MIDVPRSVLPDPEPGDDLATNRPGQELRQKLNRPGVSWSLYKTRGGS